MKFAQLQAEVPFDQYSRQYQVMTILNALRAKDETFTLLDVGGYKGRTADFLPEDKVTVLDLFDVKEPNYIKGSALKIPLKDKKVDFVTSFDVLEHIPAAKRKQFFDECARVAKRGVIICAPHKTDANEFAEQSLNEYYKKLHNEPHLWLKEHIEYGIPDFEAMAAHAKRRGFLTTAFSSNGTQLWVSMQHAIFTNSRYSMAAETLTALNKLYNRTLKTDSSGAPAESYRLILCCFTDQTDVDQADKAMAKLFKEVTVEQQLRIQEAINDYYATLTAKTNQLADNYKDLYEHEQKRLVGAQESEASLRRQLETVQARVQHLERPLAHRVAGHVKRRLRRAVGK